MAACLTGLLTGCQTAGEMDAIDKPSANALAGGLAEAIGRCWFGENETAFAKYSYSPENAGGVGRILIVPKDKPGGRPVLVIQPRDGSTVNVFGPLTSSSLGPRITADINRWRSGGTACGS